jgi:hypothetical protein
LRPRSRILLAALGLAAAAAALRAARRPRVGDPGGNGAGARTRELEQRVDEARERLRRDLERARGE